MLPADWYRWISPPPVGQHIGHLLVLFVLAIHQPFLQLCLWFKRLSKCMKRHFCQFQTLGLHSSHYSPLQACHNFITCKVFLMVFSIHIVLTFLNLHWMSLIAPLIIYYYYWNLTICILYPFTSSVSSCSWHLHTNPLSTELGIHCIDQNKFFSTILWLSV